MNNEIHTVKSFDFLARSFAHMHSQGRGLNIRAVTGNMSKEQQNWFQERYTHYCEQGICASLLEIEHSYR
ncbi:MAG TPA: glycogen synthase [Buttiauxella sp.]|uniref:glycogen synthase n=1 Tax=Buttiauxella sp. TaxID=1972222 RepID=UPI002B4604A0|nr:glycogen synthase [Buttiauxella sp.]HKM96236.1 glycogen synthase [Buttiauxella sp.]